MQRAVIAVLFSVAISLGCEPQIPEGRFQCATDEDCPPDFVCRTASSRCYETAEAPPPDGG